MEKLVYVLWKREADAETAFKAAVLGTAGTLGTRGAARVAVNLADEHVAHTRAVRMARTLPPLAGTVSFWLDAADDRASCEAALTAVAAHVAGYLVVESVPLRNTTHVAPLGERTPGINVVSCIERPARLSYDAWLAHWLGVHRAVALETQCTYTYVRNVVVRALTTDAPPWAGIVEEGFPTEAVTDPMRWYRAAGSEETFRRNLQRMMDSVNAFLDVERVESHPMSEYRITA